MSATTRPAVEGTSTTTPDEARIAQSLTLRPGDAVTGLIHFYRAEMGRLTAYRQRLDTTTSWAISSSALVATFALGNSGSQVSHAALLFMMATNYFFLALEARRFRSYEAARYRVLLLERSFYPALLGETPIPGWRKRLLESLESGCPAVSALGALGWRARRVYIWIELAVLAAWLSKLDLRGGFPVSLDEFLNRARVGSIPGWLVLLLVGLFYAWMIGLAVFARRTYPVGGDDTAVTMLMDEEPD